MVSTGTDPEGRYIWVQIQTDTEVVGFCSIYAPCNLRERKRLWKRLQEHLNDSLRWTLGGDYNFIEDSADKLGGTFRAQTTVSMEWQETRDKVFRVVDPWVTNPAHDLLTLWTTVGQTEVKSLQSLELGG